MYTSHQFSQNTIRKSNRLIGYLIILLLRKDIIAEFFNSKIDFLQN